jgi:mono/diheme cytochrome c family protein
MRELGAAILLAAAVACGGEVGGDESQGNAALTADAPPVDRRVIERAAGRALYEENCQLCHGTTGLGDGPGGATLPVKPANIREHFGDHSFEEMVRRVMEGLPPSMPVAPISEDEVRLVLSYIWSTIPEAEQARLRALQEQAAEEH